MTGHEERSGRARGEQQPHDDGAAERRIRLNRRRTRPRRHGQHSRGIIASAVMMTGRRRVRPAVAAGAACVAWPPRTLLVGKRDDENAVGHRHAKSSSASPMSAGTLSVVQGNEEHQRDLPASVPGSAVRNDERTSHD